MSSLEIMKDIVKQIDLGNKEITAENYDIPHRKFFDLAMQLQQEGFIVNGIFALGGNVVLDNARPTTKGLYFIEE